MDLGFSFYNPSIVDPYDFTSYYNGKEEGLAHSFKQIDLNYAIGKSVIDKGNFNLILGGKSRNFFYLSDYNFGPSGPSPMYISLGLDFWAQANYRLTDNQSFAANLSVPVFAHVYRDPYLAQDDEFFENLYDHSGLKVFTNRIVDGKIQSWGKYQRLDFDLRYCYSVGRNFDLSLTYYLTMNFNQSPTRYAQIGNIISMGGNIKF